MASQFCLSFRFLDPAFHGQGDGGDCEWPPSPLRVFQALVAAAARRNAGKLPPAARSALKWLEQQPPVIVAPAVVQGSAYSLSVPNNAMDIVAREWARGNDSNSGDANPATHRTMKTVRPMLLLHEAVHYLWPVAVPANAETSRHLQALSHFAGSVVALGWGIDMVVSEGIVLSSEQAATLPGERWLPSPQTSGGLRVPVCQTLEDLIARHKSSVERISSGGLFTPPPPLAVYKAVVYRNAAYQPSRSLAAFSLLKLDATGYRVFDAATRALTLAGMLRSLARLSAERAAWNKSKIDAFVLGHGGPPDATGHDAAGHAATENTAPGPRRFAYIPLPTIESRGPGRTRTASSVRRVMLTAFADDCEDEIDWACRALSGQELIEQGTKKPVALLSLIPQNDAVLRCYTQPASGWATVTPVVLPGFDDPRHFRRRMRQPVGAREQKELLARLDDRIEALLRKAIVQAGFSQVLAAKAVLSWRKTGFWPGSELADRYGVPDHLHRFPRWHVAIHWRDAQQRPVQVPGPICIGGGRFYGLGLFAAT